MEFNFYQSFVGLLNKTICQLVEKSYSAECRSVIVIKDFELFDEVDKLLWTYSRKNFLPHATKNDQYPKLQPVYITDIIENPNNSNILLLIKPCTIERNIINFQFNRVFVIDDTEEFLQQNLTILSMLGIEYRVNLFKQQLDGSWLKEEIKNHDYIY